jgi:hypothetical protein
MSAVSGGGGNYISDGAIMEWLARQQDRIYGDLRGAMDLSESRAHFADALNDIKAHLAEANRTKDFGKVDAELQAFIDKYGSDPNFAETCESLRGMADKIHGDWDYANKGYNDAYANYTKDLVSYNSAVAAAESALAGSHGSLQNSVIRERQPTPPAVPTKSYKPEDIDTWTKLIDGKLDVSSKNDQLTMIHIQELKATLDQGAQLGSTFISSGDKTIDSILHNYV